MKKNLTIFMVGLLILPCLSAQKLKKLPGKYKIEYNRIYSKLTPAGKNQVGRLVKQFETRMIPLGQKSDLKGILKGVLGAGGNMDPDMSAPLILFQAAGDMDDDIRIIMAEIKAMTKAKQKLRDFIKKLSQWISKEMASLPDDEDINNQPVSPSSPKNLSMKIKARKFYTPKYRVPFYKTPVVKPIPRLNRLPIRQLRRLLILNNNKLKVMEGLMEEISLKLKMMMDRRAKLLKTLAGAMKRITRTQKQLKDNLK